MGQGPPGPNFKSVLEIRSQVGVSCDRGGAGYVALDIPWPPLPTYVSFRKAVVQSLAGSPHPPKRRGGRLDAFIFKDFSLVPEVSVWASGPSALSRRRPRSRGAARDPEVLLGGRVWDQGYRLGLSNPGWSPEGVSTPPPNSTLLHRGTLSSWTAGGGAGQRQHSQGKTLPAGWQGRAAALGFGAPSTPCLQTSQELPLAALQRNEAPPPPTTRLHFRRTRIPGTCLAMRSGVPRPSRGASRELGWQGSGALGPQGAHRRV